MFFKVPVTGDDAHPAVIVEAATSKEALSRANELLAEAKGKVAPRAKTEVVSSPATQPYLFFSQELYARLHGDVAPVIGRQRFFKVQLFGGWYDYVIVEAYNDTDAYETLVEYMPQAFGDPEGPEDVCEDIVEVDNPFDYPYLVLSKKFVDRTEAEEIARRDANLKLWAAQDKAAAAAKAKAEKAAKTKPKTRAKAK